jgi:hypothetical protein
MLQYCLFEELQVASRAVDFSFFHLVALSCQRFLAVGTVEVVAMPALFLTVDFGGYDLSSNNGALAVVAQPPSFSEIVDFAKKVTCMDESSEKEFGTCFRGVELSIQGVLANGANETTLRVKRLVKSVHGSTDDRFSTSTTRRA